MSKMKKNKSAPRPKFENTRKVLRKQKRQQKKVHRQEHYMKKKTIPEQPQYTPAPGKFVKRPADATERDENVKKKKPRPQPSVQEVLNKERMKEIKTAEKLKSQTEEQRKKTFLQANDEEDKIIKKLEKQLGLNKSKNKNNYFADDGLDYLLEICDRSTTEQIVAAEKHLAEVEADSDFEGDLAAVTGKKIATKIPKDVGKGIEKQDHDSMIDGSDTEEESREDDGDENMDGDSDNDQLDDDVSDVENEFSGGESDGLDDEPEEEPTKSQKPNKTPEKSPKQKNINKSSKTKTDNDRIISEGDLSKVFSDDEISHLSDDGDEEQLSGNEIDEEVKTKNAEKPDVWEDIYGRKRDKEGNVIKEEKGTYVPPHLRNKDSTEDKNFTQLQRQIKSVLNKVSGTSLHWACGAVEAQYSRQSRHAANSALARAWAAACVGAAPAPARLLAEHAALVAVLHANVGSEIGAHFLQELSKMFDELMQAPQPIEDKSLENLVSCFAYLYGFKIYHASLLYDILNRLVEDISEKRIECVLCVLRGAGGALRRDEPLALRTFIHHTQGIVAGMADESATGSRIKFLLEVLMAVKNNNLTKIPNYEPTYLEHLRKTIRGIIRKGNYITPLNIRLEDLLKADERGKWWVVGSAWEGGGARVDIQPAAAPPSAHDEKLLELARKQRMNTDVRRSIFCVIMSAEDYMDAFEKLQHLGLKGQQEREIVHVLVACCLQEKTYNPYYAVLAQKLCDFDRKYQLSIQYSVWDKIKDIENLSKHCMTNLAQFLIHLIMEKGLPLSVLKIIQFSELNKHTVRFMRQILLAIIMNADLQVSLETFHRISKAPKLHMFRESLRLFIQHFLIKNAGKKSNVLNEEEMNTLRERAVEVDRILTMHENKLKF